MAGTCLGLGEFRVLRVACELPEDRATVQGIWREIEFREDRVSSLGAVYTAAERLMKKGYLTGRNLMVDAEDGIRVRRRCFSITQAGRVAIDDTLGLFGVWIYPVTHREVADAA